MAIKDVAARKAAKHVAPDSGSVVAKITRSKRPEKKRWEFSFRYFQQIDKFGLDGKGIANDWLISMLDRLKQLSLEPLENILTDTVKADAYRYHPINWGAKKIPIERKDLDIGDYAKNPEEFEIDQIMLSTGTGRIVGFFDENWVFNLVLVDPLHNLQPSKSFDYVVNPSSPLSCQLTQLQVAVHEGVQQCSTESCAAVARIKDALAERTYSEAYSVVLLKLADEKTLSSARQLIEQKKVTSYADIFEMGVMYCEDQA